MLKDLLDSPSFASLKSHISDRYEAKLNDSSLAELDKQIRFDHRDELLELIGLLYDLDVYIAVGQTARKKGFHFAEALPREANVLHYTQVFHPQVDKAIANDLTMGENHHILFLTGANMAGKSTLMKSIGIALYLGHMGFPVAAEELTFSVCDGIFSNINLADNLNAGASHYYAEVLRVKEVATELQKGKKLFVIFDELFRGTNVKDAYEATLALTRAFARKSDSRFIISTHIMEAGELLLQEPLPIQYRYLPTEMRGSMPVYTRVLREGITADRQGMIIIENEGILQMLDSGLLA
jgi:DNA mismatch repair ATPase MutS